MKVFIYERPEKNFGIEITAFEGIGNNIRVLKADGTFKEYKEGSIVEPTFFIGYREGNIFLQLLLDALIKKGYRPSIPIIDEGKLKAIEYHLEDMRKLVFKEKQDDKS